MSTRNTINWLLGWLLTAAAVGGLAQNNPDTSRLTVPSADVAAFLHGFQATDPASTTPAFTEFAKLALAGIDEQVMLSLITNTPDAYKLGADQIFWLRDVGVSKDVINAMIAHDLEVNSRLVAQTLAAPTAPIRVAWPASWLKPSAPAEAPPAKTAISTPAPSLSSPPTSVPATNRPPLLPPAPAPSSSVAAAEPTNGVVSPGSSAMSAAGGGREPLASLSTVDVEEQPLEYWQNPYPVRLPYPVKLLDPFIIMVRPW
jgi:hypothetical protein